GGATGAGERHVLALVHAAGESAGPGVWEDVDHLALTVVDRRTLVAQPEARLGQHGRDRPTGKFARQRNLLQMPHQPRRDLEAVALCAFQDGVILITLAHDLRREAEQTLRPP